MTLAKKSLGQHWLNDEISLASMCDAAEVSREDTVLEIGPGQGSLTRHLLKRAKQVIAIELDQNLAKKLSQTLQSSLSINQIATKLQLIEGDVLKFDFSTLPKDYKVVANIPYYLTSHLLRVLSESANPPAAAALLVQKEVAERVAAGPGDMSLLSASVQFYYQVSLGLVVPAKLFTPPPKVDSQILILTRHPKPLFPRTDPGKYFRVVKAGFSARRKTLLNSLSAGLRVGKAEAEALLAAAGISPNLRAQALSLDDWQRLYQAALKSNLV